MLDVRTSRRGSERSQGSVPWRAATARAAARVETSLDRMRRAPTILDAMRGLDGVIAATREALWDGAGSGEVLTPIIEAIQDQHDTVTALAAVHALARVPGAAAQDELSGILVGVTAGQAEHAVWASHERDADPQIVRLVAKAAMRGGIIALHAQTVLARWAIKDEATVLPELVRLLEVADSARSRAYLVETIGLVPGRAARKMLQRVACDGHETDLARFAAVAAFAERTEERLPQLVGALAKDGGTLGEIVTTVRAQRRLDRRGLHGTRDRSRGLRVAQVHLGSVVDEAMSRAGMGDTGGVATLLSGLGTAIASLPGIAEVVTIARGPGMRATTPTPAAASGHRFESIALHDGEGATFSSRWPSLVAARRGIRAALLANGVPDVVHLRMADPGSLAAAIVARDLGIPTVFSLAPDPHGPIRADERSGELDRAGFARKDAEHALWFRMRLVEHLAAEAREVVLFPRPRLREQLRDLTGIDIEAGVPRYTMVPEGVDVRRTDAATMRLQRGTRPGVLDDLDSAIAALPRPRRGLPLVVSVGRMHPTKGMARVAEAYLDDPELSGMANLVIVGGDLVAPNPSERVELSRIEAVLGRHPDRRRQVILLGHRLNDDVAHVLAAARRGWRTTIGAGGAYVCGSHKEEFGLAIVEAMAAGLPVVAPKFGGPASYVEPGLTGVLVDTGRPQEIAAGIRTALGLAADPATAQRTRAVVEERYTVDRMARTLAAVYRIASGTRSLSLDAGREAAA